MNDTSKILTAVLAGAAVGAATALLFAPTSGKELRSKLKDKYDSAKDGLGDLVDQGKEILGYGKEMAANAKDGAKESVSHLTNSMANKR